jgi:hypothetical protein
MTSKAKALLRALVGQHMLLLRRGEPVGPFVPFDISEQHQLGISREDLAAVAEELVAAGLCEWASAETLRILPKALEKTL